MFYTSDPLGFRAFHFQNLSVFSWQLWTNGLNGSGESVDPPGEIGDASTRGAASTQVVEVVQGHTEMPDGPLVFRFSKPPQHQSGVVTVGRCSVTQIADFSVSTSGAHCLLRCWAGGSRAVGERFLCELQQTCATRVKKNKFLDSILLSPCFKKCSCVVEVAVFPQS